MTKVVKSSGETEQFSEEKLRASLIRAGASDRDVRRVVKVVRKKLREGITTKELYRLAFATLRKRKRSVAARYGLKRAVMQLGPTGYPFEQFMGAVMGAHGYRCKVGVHLEGKVVSHEVDVVAENGTQRVLIECKYHSTDGRKSDLKVALYVYARALDLLGTIPRDDAEFWLVTNTTFTADAERYGTAVGLKLYSWDFPPERPLGKLIEESGVHPVTCLTSLKKRHKVKLLEQGLVLAKDLVKNPEALRSVGLEGTQIKRVEAELAGLPHVMPEAKAT